jgi:hypothetical protein
MALLKQLGLAGALGAMIAAAPGAAPLPANAMPNIADKTLVAPGVSDKVTEVQRWRYRRDWDDDDRRRHWRRHRRYYDDDINPGAFIALGILGALINSGYSESQARSAMERCDRRFRSFEWDTGLYTTFGGDKRLCPYLR